MSKNEFVKEIASNTREILRWVRFQNSPILKKMLEETLATPEEKCVYELADGKTSQPKLHSKTDVPRTTIGDWLRHWQKLGLVEKINGNYKKIESLKNLGIKVPKLKKKLKSTKRKEE